MKKRRILIIDDDEILGRELKELLDAEGYETDFNVQADNLENICEENTYDICILDYKIKKSTCKKALLTLKTYLPHCSAIIFSGKPQIRKTLKEENVLSLVDEIFQKPMDVSILLKTLSGL